MNFIMLGWAKGAMYNVNYTYIIWAWQIIRMVWGFSEFILVFFLCHKHVNIWERAQIFSCWTSPLVEQFHIITLEYGLGFLSYFWLHQRFAYVNRWRSVDFDSVSHIYTSQKQHMKMQWVFVAINTFFSQVNNSLSNRLRRHGDIQQPDFCFDDSESHWSRKKNLS